MTERQPHTDLEQAISAAESEGMIVQQYEIPTRTSGSSNESQSIAGRENSQRRGGPRVDHGFYDYPSLQDNIQAERMAGGE